MTTITLHGEIAKVTGREIWKLKISSVKEALHAINILCQGKLLNYLVNANKESIEYKILVNEKEVEPLDESYLKKPEKIATSELMLINKNLKTLDIVPIIKGAGGGGGGSQGTKGTVSIILGVLLIIGGAFLTAVSGPLGAAVIVAGVTLVVAGITILTMQPPQFDDFRKIDNGNGGKPSYLFDGPTNILGEGGPVPIGYGRMKIGSQAIEISVSNYEVSNRLSIPETRSKLIELQQQNI